VSGGATVFSCHSSVPLNDELGYNFSSILVLHGSDNWFSLFSKWYFIFLLEIRFLYEMELTQSLDEFRRSKLFYISAVGLD